VLVVVAQVEPRLAHQRVQPRPVGQPRQLREPGPHPVADLLGGDRLGAGHAGEREPDRLDGSEVAVVQLAAAGESPGLRHGCRQLHQAAVGQLRPAVVPCSHDGTQLGCGAARGHDGLRRGARLLDQLVGAAG
jgi:hypothetical protein